MKGQVLVLCILEVLLKGQVDWLNTEEWHWVEYSHVVLGNNLHVCGVFRIQKKLHDLFNFFVRENI